MIKLRQKLPEVLRFSRNEMRILVLLTLIFWGMLVCRRWEIRRLATRPISAEERAFEQAFLQMTRPSFSNRQKKYRLAPKGKVNINTATVQELVSLPGIGPQTAAAIIGLRKRRGKFHTIQELLLVKGIGQKKLKRIQSKISIKP